MKRSLATIVGASAIALATSGCGDLSNYNPLDRAPANEELRTILDGKYTTIRTDNDARVWEIESRTPNTFLWFDTVETYQLAGAGIRPGDKFNPTTIANGLTLVFYNKTGQKPVEKFSGVERTILDEQQRKAINIIKNESQAISRYLTGSPYFEETQPPQNTTPQKPSNNGNTLPQQPVLHSTPIVPQLSNPFAISTTLYDSAAEHLTKNGSDSYMCEQKTKSMMNLNCGDNNVCFAGINIQNRQIYAIKLDTDKHQIRVYTIEPNNSSPELSSVKAFDTSNLNDGKKLDTTNANTRKKLASLICDPRATQTIETQPTHALEAQDILRLLK